MDEFLPPIPGHSVFVLLIQLAGLLLLARGLAEWMRRMGQPAVIGELLAGILLGPTVLGRFAPDVFRAVFPPEVAQFHLLEIVAWLGMVLLLLLTGLETDIRLLRNLGRAAFSASLFGMVVPFAGGLALGWFLPDVYLTDPANRPVFAAFLATAMAISAMPVIAKILLDLNLIRRNVGIVILSAGVVDDTTGWLILSVIAGIAAGGAFSPAGLMLTLLYLVGFLAAARWLAYPLLGRAVRYVNARVELGGADLTLLLAFTFLAAAVTEAIGIHAVFGAFVAGMLIRQLPRVRSSSLHILEVFVLSALSPIFFAFVGLKVDLWALTGWGLPTVVIGVAVAGKVVGCYLGGRLGRMSHWESLALGFGMNARGAMELIVALIGLSLGLLTQEMYSTIVLVAVVTSFMAPILLRWAVPRIPLREEERRRMEDTGRQRLLPEGPLRVLVPTAGGANALGAIRLAAPLVRASRGQLAVLYVETSQPRTERRRLFPGRSQRAGRNLESHFAEAARLVGDAEGVLSTRRIRAAAVATGVLQEAARDYDLLLLGAAPEFPLHDPLTREIVGASPVPVVVVRFREGDAGPASGRILVPYDGSLFSRLATELALALAGDGRGEVVVLHVAEETIAVSGSLPVPSRGAARAAGRPQPELERQLRGALEATAQIHRATFTTRILTGGAPGDTIIAESHSGGYALLVLGTEERLLGGALFFGQTTAEIMERAGCTTAVLIPRLE